MTEDTSSVVSSRCLPEGVQQDVMSGDKQLWEVLSVSSPIQQSALLCDFSALVLASVLSSSNMCAWGVRRMYLLLFLDLNSQHIHKKYIKMPGRIQNGGRLWLRWQSSLLLIGGLIADPVQSVCQSVLGQDIESQIAPAGKGLCKFVHEWAVNAHGQQVVSYMVVTQLHY